MMGPPPPAPADAQPVIAVPAPAPLDPFVEVVIVDPRRNPRVKVKMVGGLPVVVGITELK